MSQKIAEELLKHIDKCLRLKIVLHSFIKYIESVRENQKSFGIFEYNIFKEFFDCSYIQYTNIITEISAFEIEFKSFQKINRMDQLFPFDYSVLFISKGFALNMDDIFHSDKKEEDFNECMKDDTIEILSEIQMVSEFKNKIIDYLRNLKNCYICKDCIGLYECEECKKNICEKHKFNKYCVNCADKIIEARRQTE